MKFLKYHGLGNDYLVYDPRDNAMCLTADRIRLICDRNFGIGSDGILYGPFPDQNKIGVKIYNPDGSEAEKSGNGVRIFSKHLKDAGYVNEKRFILATRGGDVVIEYLSEQGDLSKVFMGNVTYRSSEIPVSGTDRQVIDETMTFHGRDYKVTCLSVGNPHCVIPMMDVSKKTACELGQIVEVSDHFPNRINMQLLKVLDRNNIQIEIFERGAGYTLASGSSSCAAASAAYKLGLTGRQTTVHMPGGKLEIEIQPDESIYMTGRVDSVGTFIPAPEFIRALKAL